MVWDFIGCKVISMTFPFSHVILGKWQKVRLSEMLNSTKTTIVSIHWIIFVFPLYFFFFFLYLFRHWIFFHFARFTLFFATFGSNVHSQFTKFTQVQVFSVHVFRIQKSNGKMDARTSHVVLCIPLPRFQDILFSFDGNKIHRVDRNTKNGKDGTKKKEKEEIVDFCLMFEVFFGSYRKIFSYPLK